MDGHAQDQKAWCKGINKNGNRAGGGAEIAGKLNALQLSRFNQSGVVAF
jgi:hypothetical protein